MPKLRKLFTKDEKRGKYQARFHELAPPGGESPKIDLCDIEEAEYKTLSDGQKRKRTDTEFSQYLTNLYNLKLIEVKEQRHRQTKIDDRITVKDAIQLWLDNDVSDKTKKSNTNKEYTLSSNYYMEAVGDHPLEDFKPEYSLRFLSFLNKRCNSSHTILKHVRQMQRFYTWAFEEGRLIERPVKLTRPKTTLSDPQVYSQEQLDQQKTYFQKLAEESKRYRQEYLNLVRAFMVGHYGLMRSGEMCYLPLTHISLETRSIEIKEIHKDELSWSPKTTSSYRVVPICDELLEFLAQDLVSRSQFEYWYLDDGKGGRAYAGPSQLTHAVQRKNDKLGFPKGVDPIHGWRKSGITRLLSDGLPLQLVQAIAGHSNPQTTMNHYASKKELLQTALSAMNKFRRLDK
ncbi:MAG: site-specific integrase [SAR324 cluster bacterium]|nr:site-specific integrase [SAR324 cluster bacterium]